MKFLEHVKLYDEILGIPKLGEDEYYLKVREPRFKYDPKNRCNREELLPTGFMSKLNKDKSFPLKLRQ